MRGRKITFLDFTFVYEKTTPIHIWYIWKIASRTSKVSDELAEALEENLPSNDPESFLKPNVALLKAKA